MPNTINLGTNNPILLAVLLIQKDQLSKQDFTLPESLEADLYTTICFGLNFPLSVKTTDKSLGNSFTVSDNRRGISQSGFFIRSKSHLFNGGACSIAFVRAVSTVTDFLDYKAPATRLGNGHGVSKLQTVEAYHA